MRIYILSFFVAFFTLPTFHVSAHGDSHAHHNQKWYLNNGHQVEGEFQFVRDRDVVIWTSDEGLVNIPITDFNETDQQRMTSIEQKKSRNWALMYHPHSKAKMDQVELGSIFALFFLFSAVILMWQQVSSRQWRRWSGISLLALLFLVLHGINGD